MMRSNSSSICCGASSRRINRRSSSSAVLSRSPSRALVTLLVPVSQFLSAAVARAEILVRRDQHTGTRRAAFIDGDIVALPQRPALRALTVDAFVLQEQAVEDDAVVIAQPAHQQDVADGEAVVMAATAGRAAWRPGRSSRRRSSMETVRPVPNAASHSPSMRLKPDSVFSPSPVREEKFASARPHRPQRCFSMSYLRTVGSAYGPHRPTYGPQPRSCGR